MNLFDLDEKERQLPLASRMRPENIDEIVGQKHILGKDKLLYRAIKADRLGSIILYGPPGTGKTTIARVIANTTHSSFYKLNATHSGIKDIEKIIQEAQFNFQAYQKGTILFIDEIHRFNKSQQDYLLPFVEDGVVLLIGATTENPYFEVNNALLSRCRIFELKPLQKEDLLCLINRTLKDSKKGLGDEQIVMDEEAKDFLADMAAGDARSVLNALELAYLTTDKKEGMIHITLETVEECIQKKAIRYDKEGDHHYDAISAFIESMKHTDPDATLYYLARMLIAGEDIKYIARRIVVCASEDIGLANSHALEVATSAMCAIERIGMPESAKILAHAALYVCCSPKSSTVSQGIDAALEDARRTTEIPIPPFLQDASYKSAVKLGRGLGLDDIHAFPHHYSGQKCMPQSLKNHHYFHLSEMGNEKRIKTFLEHLEESLSSR